MTPEEKLKELAKFLGDKNITILKSAPISNHFTNKLCVSIYDGVSSFCDYEFEEEITKHKILENEYKIIYN